MDLHRVATEVDTIEYEIRDPRDAAVKTGVIFVLAGATHATRRAIQDRLDRTITKQFNRTGKVQMLDKDERDARDTEWLVASTLGWKGLTDDKGEEVPYSAAKARELYTDDSIGWLRRQITEALNTSENFLQGSGSS